MNDVESSGGGLFPERLGKQPMLAVVRTGGDDDRPSFLLVRFWSIAVGRAAAKEGGQPRAPRRFLSCFKSRGKANSRRQMLAVGKRIEVVARLVMRRVLGPIARHRR